MKFDDCMGNEAVVFQSSDPVFSVRTDGSIFAKGEGASLDEPVQFKVTAHGSHRNVWDTVVQLAPTDLFSAGQNQNKVSRTEISCFKFQLSYKRSLFITFTPVAW